MSAAREVGGIRRTVGRRPGRFDDPCLSKAEEEILRRGLHQSEREHGRKIGRVSKPRFGKPSGLLPGGRRKRRTAPLAWVQTFLLAYARSGQLKAAAVQAGVCYPTVRNYSCRSAGFRVKCMDALGAHVWETIQRRGKRYRAMDLYLSKRQMAALIHYFASRIA